MNLYRMGRTMKIVSLIVFALALVGSWILVNAQRPVAQSVHVGIQNDLKRIIAEYVQKNQPSAHDLHFEKFWTETLKKDKVKAYFVYTFEDSDQNGEPATLEIEGFAILNKTAETPEESTWSFDQLQILDNKVDFSEPLQVTATPGELEGSSGPAMHPDVKSEEPAESGAHGE